MKSNRKITSSEKKLFLVTGLAIAFIIAFGAWRQYVDAIPEVEIPTVELPQQNAFDVYVAAGKVLAQRSLIGYAVEGMMPTDNKNGELSDERRPANSADRLTILAANSTSLNLFQQATKFQYQEPAIRSFSTPLPYYSHFRRLTDLLIIQGREHEARRDWARAAEQYLTALEFGAKISDNATILMGWHVGQSCEGIGRNALRQMTDKLDSAQLTKVLTRLQKRDAARHKMDQIFLQESRFGQAAFIEIFQMRDWVRLVAYDLDFDIISTNWKKTVRLQLIGKRGFLDDYVRAMNAAQQDAKLPYRKRNPPRDLDSISLGFQPDFPRFYFVDARSRAAHNLLSVEFALRLYR